MKTHSILVAFKSMLTALATVCVLVSPAEANIITVTGNTVGGPTYNRPIEDLSALSLVGTNVSYNTYKITTTAAGDYTFLTSGEFDTFAFLYGGTFDPTAPLTNVLAANDDLISPPLTNSGFTFSLAAGTDYYYVTTGFADTDSGSFSTTIGGGGTITATPIDVGPPAPNNLFTFTGDTTGGPTYNRPIEDLSNLSAVGTDVSYRTHAFSVDATGVYTFMTTGEHDTFVFLYETAFDPSTPLANVLNASDDLLSPPFTTSGFAQSLTANANYIYVTTGFANDEAGRFSTTIAGPGAVITQRDNAVSEPGTVALLALTLGAIGFSRWKRGVVGRECVLRSH